MKKYLILFVPFLILAFFYLAIVPIGQTPDEPAHILYIDHIAKFGSLPDLNYSGVAHHPPLYYLIQTPFYFVFHNIYLLRFFSLVFSFLNLLVIKNLISLLFPQKEESEDLGLGTALFCSLVPMYNFMSIAVSNDPLTSILGSLAIYFSILSLNRSLEQKNFLFWALSFFAGIFTKIVLWPILFISGITIFITQKKKRILWLLVCAVSLIFLSLWFYHNVKLYRGDILGWQQLMKVEYFLVENKMLETNPKGWLLILFHSFWGIFSWFSIYLPLSVYSILRKVTVFLLVPFLIFFYHFIKVADKKKKVSMLVFFSFFVITFLALIKDNMTFFRPQGRYFFSVISVIGLYYTVGIYQVSQYVSKIIFRSYNRIIFFSLLGVPLLLLNIISAITIRNYFL